MKSGDIIPYGLLVYASATFLYNVFGIFLPFAKQGRYVMKDVIISDSTERGNVFYKNGSDFQKVCLLHNIIKENDRVPTDYAIFLDGENNTDNLLYYTIALFWIGQLIMMLVSVFDFFWPCNASQNSSLQTTADADSQSSSQTQIQQQNIQPVERFCAPCCRPLLRYVMLAAKVILVSTTYAVPAYVIAAFDFSTPCISVHQAKLFNLGSDEVGMCYSLFIVIVFFTLVESIYRCCTRGRKDYYNCFCACFQSRCFGILVPIAVVLISFCMLFGGIITATLWLKALLSKFPKSVTLAIINILRCPLEFLQLFLCSCRR
ncbi:unnamed protein product [Rotaria magnacalcarata]|uniref:Uncharacterized protein n=3 Tax=Rotaria magnacalcarata TaxID=392030 RepID=A0A816ZX09_9BILA|nr:unnamed protein product [Rotaria magnacalcarata]